MNILLQQREEAILKYWNLSKFIVRNFCLARGIKDQGIIEDCQSDVVINGLIKAVGNYDDSKGASLKTYVCNKVRYATLDHLRNNIYGRFKKIKKGHYCLRALKQNQEAKLNLLFPFSIEVDKFKNSMELSVNGTEKKVYDKDLLFKIFEYIPTMGKHVRSRDDMAEIFYLRFVKGYTIFEIAKIKNCTKSNISLVIKNGIPKIRKHFIDKEKI